MRKTRQPRPRYESSACRKDPRRQCISHRGKAWLPPVNSVRENWLVRWGKERERGGGKERERGEERLVGTSK